MNPRHFSPRHIFLFFAGLALIAVSLACGVANGAPAATEPSGGAMPTEAVAPVPETTEEPGASEPEPTSQPQVITVPQPAITEARRLTLEFPPQIRLGEGDVIRLTLEVDDLGNLTPTAEFEGNVVTGETVEIPNLYETHNVFAEARLDLAGMEVRPSDLVIEPLSPGQSATFYWSVRPSEVGLYRGTIWLYLRFVDKSNGEESRKTVSAQLVEIEAVNILGMPLGVVRTAGAVGSVIGGILGLPFLEDIVKFLIRRLKRA
ncbi:MAG: hypothetical protein AB1649_18955 [Chloroflexota bacterium]